MIGKWKSLVDTLQTDLRSVSSEAKRKHPAVKDAAERAILKLRSLSAANDKHINEGFYNGFLNIFITVCFEVKVTHFTDFGGSLKGRLAWKPNL